MDVYCSRADVSDALGGSGTSTDRLDLAAILGTAYVDTFVSGTVSSTDLTPPYTLSVVACPPAWRAAAIVAAVRFIASKDVPFGAVAVGDYGRVLGSVPEADLILRGHRTSFGIA